MIPLPRPAIPPGACQDCGRQHHGQCYLADPDLTPADIDFIENAGGNEPQPPAEQLAGSTEMQHRGPNGESHALPSPAWRRIDADPPRLGMPCGWGAPSDRAEWDRWDRKAEGKP